MPRRPQHWFPGLIGGQGVIRPSGAACTAILIIVRFVRVFPLVFLLRRHAARAEHRLMRLWLSLDRHLLHPKDAREHRRAHLRQRLYDQRRADLEQERREGLGWKGATVLGWSGMRGVVTLAAAQSLPETVPYREQLVLIAFTVAIVTLLLQGSTLPALIRVLGIRGIDASADLHESAALFDQIADAGLQVLETPGAVLGPATAVDPDVIQTSLPLDPCTDESNVEGGATNNRHWCPASHEVGPNISVLPGPSKPVTATPGRPPPRQILLPRFDRCAEDTGC